MNGNRKSQIQKMFQKSRVNLHRSLMEIQLVDKVLREIQRRSQKAARDQLYQYQKYLQNMYSKIEKLRYLAYQEDVQELSKILRVLCGSRNQTSYGKLACL